MSAIQKRPAAAAGGMRARKRPAANIVNALQDTPNAVGVAAPASIDPREEHPEWYNASDSKAQLQVFLVTAAKLVNDEEHASEDAADSLPPLVDPCTLSKAAFHQAITDGLENPIYERSRGGRPPSRKIELDTYVGVAEGKAGEHHHHAVVKLFGVNHRFLPFKLAMRMRSGIATHWSTTHSQLWSAIRYVHCTTDHKKIVDRKPLKWTRDGRKLNLFEESQEPFQVAGWKQLRESRMSEPLHKKPKKEIFTKLDFTAIILEHRLLTPNTVLEYMQENRLFAPTRMLRMKHPCQAVCIVRPG